LSDFLADILEYLMSWCYALCDNYYVAIVLFTLATKVIQFPISLWCQKNALTMVALMPEINRIKMRYFGDSDQIGEKSAELFKERHYHPLLSLIPLAIQIIILIGLVGVIYRITSANSGILLAKIPVKDGGWTWLMPLLAGGAAWLLGRYQNRHNPLQREQSALQQDITNGISIFISLSLGCTVSFGVALYWIFSNLFSIPVQALCNVVMKPRKSVNYPELYRTKLQLEKLEKSCKKEVSKADRLREKKDYRNFFKVANKKLVFHSESSGFYKYYQPLVEWLLNNSNCVIHYVTNDPGDQVFKLAEKYPRLKPYYIGPRMIIPLMMKMDADIVVMTTPDLDRFHIKRSYVRKDIEYIYHHHSLTSLTMCTREGAYDHYDTIFSVGPHQSEEIRAMEKEYRTPEKKLVPFGYALLDKLIEQFNALEKETDKKQILIAPSYQDGNILDSILDTLLTKLKRPDWRIIVRPHPQYVRRFPASWNGILARYEAGKDPDLIFETDFSSNKTIYASDLLITDWSGIAYEFSFTTGRPSLFFNTPMKVINPNYAKFGVPTDISFRDEVGVSLDPAEADRVYDIAADMIENDGKYREKIFALREKCLFNIGRTGEVGGRYIIERLIQLQKQKKNNQ
jgi:YidC/Oxa1 family membrane protein insertase